MFHKILRISWVPERLSASEKEVEYMESGFFIVYT
jgi:hypothetical protein